MGQLILSRYADYMDRHPGLRQALNDFLSGCLAHRPDNIYRFAKYWFANSLPPLDPATADSVAKLPAVKMDGAGAAAVEEYCADKATVEMADRYFDQFDLNQDGKVTMAEFSKKLK